jgi:putative OPT family oligopeptide transporter
MAKLPQDLTLRVFVISAFLTVLLAISNTYLALKVGFLTAASIPAAILSMGIMRYMKKSTVLEHNLVQTSASSGEAVAGGIVYTIPALVVIGFWDHFPYWEDVLIILASGFLGVFFSAIIRRALLSDQTLRFPEAHAITEVLRLKEERVIGFREMILGGLLAAVVEFFQSTGVMIASASKFLVKGATLFGFGVSFVPALVGAGFIIGVRVGLSLFFGVFISYLVLLPLVSHGVVSALAPQALFSQQYAMDLRFMGVGAMVVAAVITLISLLRPLSQQMLVTFKNLLKEGMLPEHDQDLSKTTIIMGVFLCCVVFYFLLTHLYQLDAIGFPASGALGMVFGSIAYILVMGFIVVVVCGYFSGLVGVSASPGSSIMIAGMILSTLLVHFLFQLHFQVLAEKVLLQGEAVAIIIGTIVMSIACIANDTSQDLKVGQMLKASPRKQQIMLLFGVTIAALVIPFVMNVLYQAYGFVGHMPRPDMNPNNALAIPPAAVMAQMTQGIFNGDVPWHYLEIGAVTMLVLFVLNLFLSKRQFSLSLLGVGIGMYLPLSSSMALVLGSFLALILQVRVRKMGLEIKQILLQKKLLLACGFVTGATLMDVILAVPIALNPGGASLSFNVASNFEWVAGIVGAGFLVFVLLGFRRR